MTRRLRPNSDRFSFKFSRSGLLGVVFLTLAACIIALLAAGASAASSEPRAESPSFIAFESGPVRPLALTPAGDRLIAANIPDSRIEVFQIQPDGSLLHEGAIPVGLEPVAVAARTDTEIWVVNHLSDSISIVDLAQASVVRTLLVGDEPRDIVFAGPDGNRAFITTAHRGQQRTDPSLAGVPGAGDPQLTTPGVPRADVWVFDAANLGDSLGGTPLRIVELFGDTPRALAATPDGGTVYAAIFHSGNQTTAVSEGAVCNGFEAAGPCPGDGITSPGGLPGGLLPGGNPGPAVNHAGEQAPEVGLVVKYDNDAQEWRDELGRNWNNGVRFHLPDLDVFAIDAAALTETASFAHVGAILFNMAVNPASGRLYVANTDAQNHVRFEGAGDFAGSTVQGDLARTRITVVDPATGAVQPRHLNKHIDYSQRPAPPAFREHSLATPLEMAVSSDGLTLYVAAFGSGKVGVFQTATLEDDSFDPTVESANYIPVSGGGPGGLILDEGRNRLYVFTRFDNGLSVVDLASSQELEHLRLFNPEPAEVVTGRPFLYDATQTSSNGEASCSSCHVFGDLDSLAWDLGDPDGDVASNPILINLAQFADDFHPPINGTGQVDVFHPMKGPMTTQTLRGLVNSGAQHWRGDRSNGFFGESAFDSELSFKNFIVAFPGLLGADIDIYSPPVQEAMQQFTDFALQLTLPPNPVRNLNNSLTLAQQAGFDFFVGNRRSDGLVFDNSGQQNGFRCEGCHRLNPAQGFFGAGGEASFENETQIFKIAHLRNMYQKVGMFGMPHVEFTMSGGNFQHMGDQIRGTGYIHDGSIDTLFRFFRSTVFQNSGGVGFNGGDTQRRNMEAFMLAFDSDLAPIVGQQITVDASNWAVVRPRVQLLLQRARTPFVSKILGGAVTECDLVVQATMPDRPRGWLYNTATGLFDPDSSGDTPIGHTWLRLWARLVGAELTYTCAPPGSGVRMALDRDLDGILNGDDPDWGAMRRF